MRRVTTKKKGGAASAAEQALDEQALERRANSLERELQAPIMRSFVPESLASPERIRQVHSVRWGGASCKTLTCASVQPFLAPCPASGGRLRPARFAPATLAAASDTTTADTQPRADSHLHVWSTVFFFHSNAASHVRRPHIVARTLCMAFSPLRTGATGSDCAAGGRRSRASVATGTAAVASVECAAREAQRGARHVLSAMAQGRMRQLLKGDAQRKQYPMLLLPRDLPH